MAHSGKMPFLFPILAHTFVFLFFSSFISPLVFHPVECSYCHSESMMGFRYRCQQCHNYQLCQDCFWRGHAGGSHSNQHQMKEYTSWVRQGPLLDVWESPRMQGNIKDGDRIKGQAYLLLLPSFLLPILPPPPFWGLLLVISEPNVASWTLKYRKTQTMLLLGI